jgi:hypothetical protein
MALLHAPASSAVSAAARARIHMLRLAVISGTQAGGQARLNKKGD